MTDISVPEHEALVRFVVAIRRRVAELASEISEMGCADASGGEMPELVRRKIDAFYERCGHFDALPQDVKVGAIKEAHEHEMEPEEEAAPIPDPFSQRHCPGPSWPVQLPDEGRFAAHRAGKLDVIGYGATQLEAIDDLERREGEREAEERLAR